MTSAPEQEAPAENITRLRRMFDNAERVFQKSPGGCADMVRPMFSAAFAYRERLRAEGVAIPEDLNA